MRLASVVAVGFHARRLAIIAVSNSTNCRIGPAASFEFDFANHAHFQRGFAGLKARLFYRRRFLHSG